MKATGIVRKVDELGRVVLPIELRRTLNLNEGDGLEVYTDNESIILKKYTPGCTFCDNMDCVEFLGKWICSECISKLKDIEDETFLDGYTHKK